MSGVPRVDPVTPAAIDWLEDGTPRSRQFDDRYFSNEPGSAAQSRHVFLGGNGLPARWRGCERFTILEAGIGLAGNFLATWQAWSDDTERPARLFYIGIDRHPPTSAEVLRAHGAGSFGHRARSLAKAWPPAVAGLHRLDFDAGRVVLLLGFGDIEPMCRQLDARVDAFYLDGFSPDRNPQMWTAAVAAAMRRIASDDATLASWTIARSVRDAWSAAGFELERRAGLPPKRDMIVGRVVARPRTRHRRDIDSTIAIGAPVIVVGAGLAGAATAHALAVRGFEVTIVDPLGIANATSGNRMAALQPLIARDENPTVRMTRSAFLLSVRRIAAFDDASIADLRGLLDVDDTAPDALRELAVRLALPGDFARVVEVDEARALTQSSVTRGGWWFAHGGWVAPRRYAMRLIESAGPGVSLQQARVTRIETLHSIQHVTLDDGRVLTAAAVVLANAAEATRFAPQLPAMQRLRGQLTELPSTGFDAPSRPITGDGYVMPALDARVMLGATYEFDGDPDDPRPQALGHRENLSRLARLVGTAPVIDDLTSLEGRVGWRAINTDRLPSIGALDADEPHRLVLAGLGSRGVTWAALAGEQIAARLAGDPAPFERWIARATDPLRFARRRAGAA